MFRSYLKIAYRNFLKNKFYAFINISGLALGMVCCVVILLYLKQELSFDKFHKHADDIFRITEITQTDALVTHTAHTYSAVAPVVANEFAEVVATTRFFNENTLVAYNETKSFQEPRFFYTDSSTFDVFTFNPVKGNLSTALDEPFSVIVTHSMAVKYFGDADPINKILRIDDANDFRITAVIGDIPKNSHIQIDFLASYSSLKNIQGGWMYNNWYYPPMYTYLKLLEGKDASKLEGKLPGMVEKFLGPGEKKQRILKLQSLLDIHTTANLENEWGDTLPLSYVFILSTVAVLILVIACINFMNLSIARSLKRAAEVGMRKVVGAHRGQLIQQFLYESSFIAVISSIVALGLLYILVPIFNQISGAALVVGLKEIGSLFLFFLSLSLVVGLAAGYYPALFLASFNPNTVLKGNVKGRGSFNEKLSKGLVIFQFLITITLIVGTLIIYNQLQFLKNKHLGFDKEHLVVVHVRNANDSNKLTTLKDRLEANTNIISVSASSRVPGRERLADYNIRPEGSDQSDNMMFYVLHSSFGFENTLGLEFTNGRPFNMTIASDSFGIVLNETAVQKLGWADPLGKKIETGALEHDGSFKVLSTGNVIGVVKNFNYNSLHKKIDPLMMVIGPYYMNQYLNIRTKPNDIQGTLGLIQKEWSSFSPGRPFEYFFLDENIDRLYQVEERLSKIFLSFSILSIFIACLGLFAMATFAVRQKRKEIGIRKILGASVKSVFAHLLSQFSKLIIIAFLVSVPLSYFGLDSWLNNFAFHIQIDVGVYIVGAIISIIITVATIGYQTIIAAKTNPVDTLRSE